MKIIEFSYYLITTLSPHHLITLHHIITLAYYHITTLAGYEQ
ncbi:MAG: hypothetical protein NTW49_06560 [Bacteroidia bacterium]|nr:hypothetical protein [Bacteroidia bacterium]